MPFIVSSKPLKQNEPIEPGDHRAVCVALYNIGRQPDETYGLRERIVIGFELPDLPPGEYGEVTAPRMVYRRFNLALGPKSNLRAFLEAWRGRPYPTDKPLTLDLTKLLGVAAIANIEVKEGKNGPVASLVGIRPAERGNEVGTPTAPIMFDIADLTSPMQLEGLPKFIITLVKESEEFKRLPLSAQPSSATPPTATAPRPTTPAPPAQATLVSDDPGPSDAEADAEAAAQAQAEEEDDPPF